MGIDTTKIEDRAVRAVGDYIDDCPKLKSYCQSNDKTPVWDGDIIIYKSKEHNVRNIFARVPLQIKGTTSSDDDSYRIEREYLEAYQSDRGCVFFMVQEDKETYKAIRILYAMLSLKDVNALLQHNTQTIKIDLQEPPDDCSIFEEELIKFAKKRNGEKLDAPAPKEIASLVKRFKEVEHHLDEVKDKGDRILLQTYIKAITDLKNDGTVGWRDTFVYLSREALDLAIKHIKDYDFLYLQHDLGLYLQNQKLYHLVEDYYVKSLKDCRERAKNNPSYDRLVALTLNNLANLHTDLNQLEIAEEEYKETLEIYRNLAKVNPEAYLPNVATTLNNLAVLYWNLNRHDIAEVEYKEALEIYRNLAKANPDAFLPFVATTLNNLGVQHNYLNQREIAEADFKEALEIRRKLAKDNPDDYLPDIAVTLNNLANLHNVNNQPELAEGEYKEALEIRRNLANENPNAYLPDFAETLNNLAVLHSDLNRLEIAEAEYKEALIIRRNLTKDNPNAYLGDVAMTLFNIAILRLRDHRKDEAKEACEEALDFFKAMAKTVPQKWNKDVNDAQQLLDFINIL